MQTPGLPQQPFQPYQLIPPLAHPSPLHPNTIQTLPIHVTPKQTERYPEQFGKRIEKVLDLVTIEEELTKFNYKKKFYNLICWEEKTHIDRLREKYVNDRFFW